MAPWVWPCALRYNKFFLLKSLDSHIQKNNPRGKMTSTAGPWRIMPPHLAEQQISQIDLLMAMFPGDQEIMVDEASEQLLDGLRKYCEEGSTLAPGTVHPTVTILLTMMVEDPASATSEKTLQLDISVPFSWAPEETQTGLPRSRVRIRQAPWLSRASLMQFNSRIPHDSEDIFTTINFIQEAATSHLEAESLEYCQDKAQDSQNHGPLVRVWFYFPSISTRSKRDDFVINAPAVNTYLLSSFLPFDDEWGVFGSLSHEFIPHSCVTTCEADSRLPIRQLWINVTDSAILQYGLTGFLCAGKPGLLCLEGESQSIDDYMKFIKTESWGDIPAHHKKVSERHREKDILARVFHDMQEITDSVGERRGQRANRGDMKAMEGWLVARGLGDAFAKVLM